ncbi:MAG: peptidoglycan DD-metalloendopeptidase family protein [Sulfuriferula sp.]
MRRVWGLFCVSLALAGCSTTQVAPVVDLTGANATAQAYNKSAGSAKINGSHPATHVVQRGDTLYSIALEYGLDYRELAAWNHLSNLNHIQIGQTLNVAAPGSVKAESPSQNPATQDLVTTQPLIMSAPIVTTQALPDNNSNLIRLPQAVKLPYSKAALAQIAKLDAAASAQAQTGTAGTSMADNAAKSVASVHDGSVTANNDVSDKTGNDSGLDWAWPANGPVIAKFGDASADKGIDISGVRGQPIFAAAAGKVVYSGAGLHGYGKLVIIKHNAIYLTAYAHNEQILVKEGQTVSRGQKIAEMGDSDADRVELHFEVRKMGKPVDPLIFLPEAKK